MRLWHDSAEWLEREHPGLVVEGEHVSGELSFIANYNDEHNLFVILSAGDAEPATGRNLSGEFKISIAERTDKRFSTLPAVKVDGVEPTADRHFSQLDQTACLCSPFEESEFIHPDSQFEAFLERLVIPFLYAQKFYSEYGRWPWMEYPHYVTGLLESYSDVGNPDKARDCLHWLSLYPTAWPRIRSALQKRDYIKGHTPCLCERGDAMRRCHPKALQGIRQLHADVRSQSLPLPALSG